MRMTALLIVFVVLVGQPRLLLLDEPLWSLEPELGTTLRSKRARLQHDPGLTMVYVTHDTADAALADDIGEMRAGRVVSVSATRREESS
jgi:putative spermidine/putrescine transport system ATP-binding protein